VVDHDGWFSTGDVATIDPDGYVQLTDRLKDVIKSGGEWISSIEIENLAVTAPGRVRGRRVIAVHHPVCARTSAAVDPAQALYRCLQRHDIGLLPEIQGSKLTEEAFKAYPIGFFHIDIAEMQTA
jgi:acyl-CoA synthetase (AMP-forming)/AMP-acid ligase II